MGDANPKYVLRGKVSDRAGDEAVARYMAKVIAGVIGIAVLSGEPFIEGKPRAGWRRLDWGRLCEEGTVEDAVYGLLADEDPAELRRTFNTALTLATNGIVLMHQAEFLSDFGTIMANILATEGGTREYLHPDASAPARRRPSR